MRDRRTTANPYRRAEDGVYAGGSWASGSMRAPRNHATDQGPGLVASDLDTIARHHYQDGYAAAERLYEGKLEAALDAKADAFDEGTVAQDGLNTALVWEHVHRALIAMVHWPLRVLEDAPKSKRDEAIATLRWKVDELLSEAAAAAAE